MKSFNFLFVPILLVFINCTNTNTTTKTTNKSENSVTNQKETCSLDSIIIYNKQATVLFKNGKIYEALICIEKSGIGNFDYTSTIYVKNHFTDIQIQKLIPIFNHYAFILSEDYKKDVINFNKNFNNLSEIEQHTTVQSLENLKNERLGKAAIILKVSLILVPQQEEQSLFLANILYSMHEYGKADEAYLAYLVLMKKIGKEDQVPSYVINPNERKVIGEE